MSREIQVWVSIEGEDTKAGTLFHHYKGGTESATFLYDESYLADPSAYSLDPALPLVAGAQPTPGGRALFNAFSDSSPDRWGRSLIRRAEVLTAKAEGRATRSLSEVDYLLGARDDLRQGNLRFRTSDDGAFLAVPDDGVPAVNELSAILEISARIESGDADLAELHRMLQAGSSLGGMRPKSHIRKADGSVAIAKFPSSKYDEWDVIAWEKVALDLAKTAGIEVPRSELVQVAGRNVLIVDRFDRTSSGQRVGYASALTMLEATDGETRSYVDIAAALEENSSHAGEDLGQLWRRMAFSVLISNTDDHLRNHGFLHDYGTSWRLAPAFDLNPNPEPGTKHHRTALGEDESDTASSIATLLEVAPIFRIDQDQAIQVLSEVRDSISGWREMACGLGLSRVEVELLEPAFEHERAQEAADLM